MVGTQVYLSAEQHDALGRAAQRSRISRTEALRRLIDQHLPAKGGNSVLARERVFALVGSGESGATDVAERHDDYLAKALSTAPASH